MASSHNFNMIYRTATVALFLGFVVESLAGYGFYPYKEEYSDDGQVRTYSTEGRGKDALQFAKGYNTGLEEKNKAQQEGGYYSAVEADHTHYGDGEKSYHDSYRGQKGKAEEALSNKAGHNKGFSTTGFQDFHHKDEVGKKTTFYDSSDNTGDQYDYKVAEEVYGNKGVQGAHKNTHDGKYNEMSRGDKGSYGHDDILEHKNYKSDLYEKKGYSGDAYDNEEYGYVKKYEGVKKPVFYPNMVKKPYPVYPAGYYYPHPHPHFNHY